MTKKLIKTIIVVLVVTMLSSNFAYANIGREKENNEKEYCLQNFNLIEAELTSKGTSIEDELSMFYQDFDRDTKQIKNKNIYSGRAMNSGSKQVLKSIETVLNERESIPLETYYLGLAGAIIAWFNYKDYKLSAELLNYSTINKTVDSYYYPTYGSQVMASNVYKNIKKNTSVPSGSGTFPNSGSTAEKDLYYSIHKFNWYRQAGQLIISDRYDFAYDKDYWGTIAGVAIKMMYDAQSYGFIKPYYVRIYS